MVLGFRVWVGFRVWGLELAASLQVVDLGVLRV